MTKHNKCHIARASDPKKKTEFLDNSSKSIEVKPQLHRPTEIPSSTIAIRVRASVSCAVAKISTSVFLALFFPPDAAGGGG